MTEGTAIAEAPPLTSTLEPMGGRVIARQDDVAETTEGGIVLPQQLVEQAKNDRPRTAVILAVSEGWQEGEKAHEHKLQVGDRIFFSQYGSHFCEVDGEEYVAVHEKDVLARVRAR